ncbi:MAG TPA: putative porin, partial [bacterium]|nr:putative porin [bacterium]
MLKKLFFLLMVVFFSCMLSAEISTEEREKLKNELKDEIKKELKEDLKKEKNILDMFSLNGKIKTRYEFEKKAKIDRSGHDTRHRGVFEAKLGFVFRPVDYFKAGFGLASGAETPVSSNETMKGQASSKPIFLDLAYIEVHPYYKWISLLTGKFRNPLFKAGGSQMVWD